MGDSRSTVGRCLRLVTIRGVSSVGRASALHAEGRGIVTPTLHSSVKGLPKDLRDSGHTLSVTVVVCH